MNKIVEKEGLYERVEITTDIPVPKYKNYINTEKNKIDLNYNSKIPLLYIESEKNIKYKNGILNIEGIKQDVSLLTIKEVIEVLSNNNITVNVLDSFYDVNCLPSYILTEFNNKTVEIFNGEISPLNIKYIPKNKTIYSIEEIIENIKIINTETNSIVPFTNKDNNLFYEVGKNTKVYLNRVNTKFYIFGDLDSKIIYNGTCIANLGGKI